TDGASLEPQRYQQPGETFGSMLRDRAILLPVLGGLKRHEDAQAQVQAIAGALADDSWYSTQSVAWALMSLSRYFDTEGSGRGLDFAWRQGEGDWQAVRQAQAMVATRTPEAEAAPVAVRNDSDRPLYVVLSNRGVPVAGQERGTASG